MVELKMNQGLRQTPQPSLAQSFPSSEARPHCISRLPRRRRRPRDWAQPGRRAEAPWAPSGPRPLGRRPALSALFALSLPIGWATRRWQQGHRDSRATERKLSGSLKHHGRKAAHRPGEPAFDYSVGKKQVCVVFEPLQIWGAYLLQQVTQPHRSWHSQLKKQLHAASGVTKWSLWQHLFRLSAGGDPRLRPAGPAAARRSGKWGWRVRGNESAEFSTGPWASGWQKVHTLGRTGVRNGKGF